MEKQGRRCWPGKISRRVSRLASMHLNPPTFLADGDAANYPINNIALVGGKTCWRKRNARTCEGPETSQGLCGGGAFLVEYRLIDAKEFY